MARIFFIRHGQASFLESNYDKLSELGHQQAILLGQFWRKRHLKIDKVFCGNLRRQNETAQGLLKGLQSQIVIEQLEGFNEHHGPEIVKPIFPEKFVLDKPIDIGDYDKYRKQFYGAYFELSGHNRYGQF